MAPCTYRVESFLGCISLQRGVIIIGFLYLFGSLLELVKFVHLLVGFEVEIKHCEKLFPSFSDIPDIGPVEDDDGTCPRGYELRLIRSKMLFPILIIFISFILTVLMIHGARKDRPKLIAPWVWWQLSFLIVSLIVIIGFLSFYGFLVKITGLFLAMYFLTVVNSYYLKLLQQERNPSQVTVIAMAHRRADMTVTIPSSLKDDPPPPYHSCYIPPESLYPPPYDTTTATTTTTTTTSTSHATLPPPYQSVDGLNESGASNTENDLPSIPSLVNSSSATLDPGIPRATQDTQQQEASASIEEAPSTPEAVGERVPLVVKLSQNN